MDSLAASHELHVQVCQACLLAGKVRADCNVDAQTGEVLTPQYKGDGQEVRRAAWCPLHEDYQSAQGAAAVSCLPQAQAELVIQFCEALKEQGLIPVPEDCCSPSLEHPRREAFDMRAFGGFTASREDTLSLLHTATNDCLSSLLVSAGMCAFEVRGHHICTAGVVVRPL